MGKTVSLWILAVAAAGITVYVLFSFQGTLGETEEIPDPGNSGREVLAAVGSCRLYASDLAAIRAGEGAVDSWVEDQLLAYAAEDAGLENPSLSRFVQERAKQLYLRDLMVEHIINLVEPPDSEELLPYMEANPELFMEERHYFQIITSDSSIAESLHVRLGWGQNFQVTAQNASLGQKAAIGGDLGFVTGGEMLLQGLPMEVALLDGLSDVVASNLGWHIFKVTEIRELTDTLRVVRSAAEVIYRERIDAAIDSVIRETENRISVEVTR
jgi:parvulin-like peptidyl-prolyl isomerase